MLRTKVLCRPLVYDIVIVGGGPIGSAIAYHCASKRLGKIAVIERDKTYQSCSAMLSAGGIRQQFSVPENVKMSIYGAKFLKNMEELAVNGEIPDINFRENGYLYLAGHRSKHILEQNNATQLSCGADWMDLLGPTQLAKKFPWLNIEGIDLGSFGRENEGYFDPWAYVLALKKKSISLGVDYIDGDVVGAKTIADSPSSVFLSSLHVQPAKSKVHAGNNAGSDLIATSPPTFEISAGHYVNAAGAWAGKLVEVLKSGIQRPAAIAALPVVPKKRCIFSIHCPKVQVKSSCSTDYNGEHRGKGGNGWASHMWQEYEHGYPPPPHTCPLVIGPQGVYFRPEGQGGKYIAGVSPSESEDPDCDDSALQSVDHKLFEEVIWPKLYEMVPAFEELKVTASWAGFYDYNTLDQNAIIGHHPELKNLILCNGFSGHGLQQSPAAGRAISEIILNSGKFETLDLRRFSFERVLTKNGIHESGIV